MNSINSLPLWSGLAALGIAAPILIHLWSRNQKFETPWAAMELLKKALIARSQKIRTEDYLLLVLRCLTLFLIAVALLRPLFNASGSFGVGSRSVGVVIGIDASYSMNHGEHARFERAIGKAREILSTLGEGDPVSIVLMSKNPQVLFRRRGYDPGAFTTELDKLTTASSHSLNLQRNLDQLQELVDELKTASQECYIITDAQMTDWQSMSDQTKSSLERLCKKSRVTLSPVSGSGVENLAITDFSYSAGSLQRDESARFAATVRNEGSGASEGAAVEFYADGKLKSRQEVERFEAGETRTVSFYTSFAAAGDIALTARLSKDDLLDDNQRHTVVAVQSSVRVLCIDGDFAVSTAKMPRGGHFLVRALRLKHVDADAPVIVTHADAADLFREKLSDYDVVVMINVPDVSTDLSKRLHQFTAAGGGLLFFLGDKIDPEQYNQVLVDGEYPVLPVRLVETIEHDDPGEGWQIVANKSEHPLAQVVGRLPPDLTAEARFQKIVRAVPLKDSESILELGDGTLPLLVGNREGKGGRVLLFTSSADRTWNGLPDHPLFTILLQQSATMLSSPAELGSSIVGDPATIALPGRRIGGKVNVTDPLGESAPAKTAMVKGTMSCQITPQTPGVYRVAAEGGHQAGVVAANVDTDESDVRMANSVTLERWLDDIPVVVISDGLAEAAFNGRTGRDLGLTLLTLGILCFVAQGLLANHLSRRKHSGAGDVVASLKGRRVAASRRF